VKNSRLPSSSKGKGDSSTSRPSSSCGRCSTSTRTCGPARPTKGTRSTTAAIALNNPERQRRSHRPGHLPREHRGHVRRASSSTPIPEAVYTALCANPKMKPWKDKGLENVALSTRIVSVSRVHEHLPPGLRVREEDRPQARDPRREAQRPPRDRRPHDPHLPQDGRGVQERRHLGRRSQHRRDLHVDVQEPAGLLRPRRREHVRRHRERPLRGPRRRPRFRAQANIGDRTRSSSPPTARAPKYAGQYKVNPIAMLLTAKMMIDWLGESERATRLETAIARVIKRGQGPHLRHGRNEQHHRRRQGHRGVRGVRAAENHRGTEGTEGCTEEKNRPVEAHERTHGRLLGPMRNITAHPS
jgi:hypothetical protein